ncbi:MAG: threonine-phosphate decarboxylase [Proteobacteria bacterium]|nr:threonine-phosphate decarboxylase [Pseudomonadota bacterium]
MILNQHSLYLKYVIQYDTMTHRHGGNIISAARRSGRNAESIIDFSASINPLGISPMAREAVIGAIDSVQSYPEPEMSGLISALSAFHGMPPENILAGNGSTELIYLIPRALKPKRVLVVAPSFSEYEASLRNAGCKIDYIELEMRDSFKPKLKAITDRLDGGHDMLWIANPGNPVGNIVPRQDMLRLIREAEKKGVLVVVDEAFIDFSESDSVKDRAASSERLIVLRSLTKFYAIAGLRVGYLFGSEAMVTELAGQKEPWSVNCLGEAAAIASLRDEDYRQATLALIEGERDFLFEAIGNIALMRPFQSNANYIFVRLDSDMGASKLCERMLMEEGLLLRDCSNFQGLDNRYIRMAVRKREDNIKLISSLERIYGQ